MLFGTVVDAVVDSLRSLQKQGVSRGGDLCGERICDLFFGAVAYCSDSGLICGGISTFSDLCRSKGSVEVSTSAVFYCCFFE